MSKNKTQQKPRDIVGEYLVKRIKEVEQERDDYQARFELSASAISLLENKVKKFIEVQKLFKVEGDCIVVRNFENNYVGILAVELADKQKYQNYLDLLELRKEDFE